jgi:hypothetical protein
MGIKIRRITIIGIYFFWTGGSLATAMPKGIRIKGYN